MSARNVRPTHKLDMSYILNGDHNNCHDSLDINVISPPTVSKRRPTSLPGQEGDRKYICSQCSFAFRSKGDMAKHDRSVHQGIRKHTCPQCGSRFAEKGNLTKHMKRHEGIREHFCTHPGCSKTFVLRDGLIRHLKSVHGKDVRGSSSRTSNLGPSALARQGSHHFSRLRK